MHFTSSSGLTVASLPEGLMCFYLCVRITQTVAGGSVQGVAAVAPTVVAAVSATSDSAAKVLQVVAPPASVAATPVSQQQLPITVQVSGAVVSCSGWKF